MSYEPNDVIVVKWLMSCKPPDKNISLAINTCHYLCVTKTAGGATEQEVADAFSQALSPQYRLLMNTNCKYEGCIVQRVHPLPLGVQFTSLTNAGPATLIGEGLPLQICGMLTKLTPFAGRKFRGRIYVPFPMEADNGPLNIPNANYLTNIFSLGASMIASRTIGLTGISTFNSVLFRREAPPGHTTAITGIHNREYWGTQRRRSNAWKSDTLPSL